MPLTIVLTEEIRKLPYFSDFKEDEVEVPDKPFLWELLHKTLVVKSLAIEVLVDCIETSVYFGLDTTQLILEFLWKIGAEEDCFGKWVGKNGNKWTLKDGLSMTLEQELNTALGKPISRKRLIELGIRCIRATYPEISAGGNLRLLKWADGLAQGKSLRNVETFSITAKHGHLKCLKYLRWKGCPWNERAAAGAAGAGHLDCLKYLFEQGIYCGHDAIPSAARNGQLECLKYLHERNLWYHTMGVHWMKSAAIGAAKNGHLDCLKYLHEKGYPWDEWTAVHTAENGRLECLKYLHEQGCPWDEKATGYACRKGQLDCLKYLHENGCPWDALVPSYAIRNGHENCLKYLREHGCPGTS